MNNLRVVCLMRTSEVEEDWRMDIEGKLAGSLSIGLGQEVGLNFGGRPYLVRAYGGTCCHFSKPKWAHVSVGSVNG
jgi:hypothetical protein